MNWRRLQWAGILSLLVKWFDRREMFAGDVMFFVPPSGASRGSACQRFVMPFCKHA